MSEDSARSRPGRALDPTEQLLYARREKIYPREVHGLFATLRWLGVLILLGIYYVLPWVPWDGRQAVLFDLPNRKFYLFGLIIWPQDFVYLALLLVIAAFALFFFTALAGRLWCGYACPQTVWTEVFLWMERLIEGDRPRQMKLDLAPWNAHKVAIKSGKHALWIAFSLYTGFTFVGYFTPIDVLWTKIASMSPGPWETFWILFYGFATYGNAGWLREQVCIYMCPYARFQGAMFDRDTLIISYDDIRGEPRGSRRRNEDPRAKGLGDCIDCTMCVQVCPTGIDIRDGLQYQCIACAACIDVCNDVMAKMDYPEGLIRYTTLNALQGAPARLLRPRVVIYAGILVLIVSGFLYSILHRKPLDLDIIRDRNALYREVADGRVENVYTVKVLNKDIESHRYRIEISGIDGLVVYGPREDIEVPAGTVYSLVLRVRADPGRLPGASTVVHFTVTAQDRAELSDIEDARFIGPVLR